MRTTITTNYDGLGNTLMNVLPVTRAAIMVSAALVMGLSACGQQGETRSKVLNEEVSTQPSAAINVNEVATAKVVKDINIWPQQAPAIKVDPELEQKIAALLATMTLEQKVAQMIQPEIRDITVEDMRKYGFGSYLNGGGAYPNNDKHATPADWIALAESFYQASIDDSLDGSSIPTMWGTDAVHGHNNVIGATLFPHNIGLGAADNPKLIEEIAAITGKEVMVVSAVTGDGLKALVHRIATVLREYQTCE